VTAVRVVCSGRVSLRLLRAEPLMISATDFADTLLPPKGGTRVRGGASHLSDAIVATSSPTPHHSALYRPLHLMSWKAWPRGGVRGSARKLSADSD
jgi:hypothetical protein